MLCRKIEFEFANHKKDEFDEWLKTIPSFVNKHSYPDEQY